MWREYRDYFNEIICFKGEYFNFYMHGYLFYSQPQLTECTVVAEFRKARISTKLID